MKVGDLIRFINSPKDMGIIIQVYTDHSDMGPVADILAYGAYMLSRDPRTFEVINA